MATGSVSKPLLFLAAGAATLAGIGAYAWHEEHRQQVLEVFVFDTPGVPSVFIRTPADRRILIDGGSNASIVRYLSQVLPFYSRRIDSLVVTKPEGRHVTGLIDVLERYTVDEVLLPSSTLQSLGLVSSSDSIYDVFLYKVASLGLKPRFVGEGEKLEFDHPSGSQLPILEVLFPAPPELFSYSKASGPSLLWRLRYGVTDIVMMGSVTQKVQKYLANKLSDMVDILMLTMSPTASNIAEEIIQALRPEFLVYSQTMTAKSSSKISDNKKVDPLAGFLREQRFNIKETGMVRILSDGASVTLRTR